MDRLIDECGVPAHCWKCKPEPCDHCDTINEVFKRLAAYEDTDLSPEICREYKIFEDEIVSKGVTIKRIVEFMNAEAEGRIMPLPCKVGDEIYIVGRTTKTIVQDYIIHIIYDGEEFYLRSKSGALVYTSQQLGKTVFLTREEAEAALKGADT